MPLHVPKITGYITNMFSVEDDENSHTRSSYTNKVKKFHNQLLTKVMKVLLNIDGNAVVKPESSNITKDFSNLTCFHRPKTSTQ